MPDKGTAVSISLDVECLFLEIFIEKYVAGLIFNCSLIDYIPKNIPGEFPF